MEPRLLSERLVRPLNILLVDDDDLAVMNMRRAFTRGQLSRELWAANDGHEALAVLRGGALPQARRLVLLDVDMPRMDGLTMLAEIRRDPALQATSVVLLTSSDADEDRAEAFRLNAAGYLLKPATFAQTLELVAAIDQYWSRVELP